MLNAPHRRYDLRQLSLATMLACVSPLAGAATADELAQALPRAAIISSALHVASGDTEVPAPDDGALVKVGPPGAVVLSSGQAADDGLGDTDALDDGLPDHVNWTLDIVVPAGASAVVFRTAFVTAEFGKPQPDDDEAWVERRDGEQVLSRVILGASGSSLSSTSRAITTYFDVRSSSTITLAFGVEDRSNGARDSALILYDLYFEFSGDLAASGQAPGTPSPPADVDLASGSFSLNETLLQVQGVRLPFVFAIAYSSASERDGALGRKWLHSFEWEIEESADGTPVVRQGDGRNVYFRDLGGGEFEPRHGPKESMLVRASDGGYLLRQKDQTTYVFGADRRLAAVREPYGNEIRLTYTSDGVLQQVLDAGGGEARFAYSGDHLTRITYLRAGSVVADLAFTQRGGDLVAFSELGGRVTRLVYDDSGNLLTATNADGRLVTDNSYDTEDRVIAQRTRRAGRLLETSIGYEGAAGEARDVRVTSPEGRTQVFRYAANDRLIRATSPKGRTWEYAYDEAGNMISTTGPLAGDLTEMEYDDAGNMVLRRDALGRETRSTYDSRSNLVERTDESGASWHYTYSAEGRPTRVLGPLGEPAATAEYASSGLKRRTIDRRGATTTLDFDDRTGDLLASTDALGQVVSVEYDGLGRRVRAVDQNGQASRFEYDEAGRLARTIDAGGVAASFRYDADGRPTTVVRPSPIGAIEMTRAAYDESGQLLRETDPFGHSVRYQYDDDGLLVSVADKLNHVTRYEYDDDGQMTAVVDPAGQRAQLFRDAAGRRIGHAFPDGNRTDEELDLLGRTVASADALGNRVAMTYDPRGPVATHTNARGQLTEMVYDAELRLVEVRRPERTTRYVLDPEGSPVEAVTSDGERIAREFDALGRLTSRTDPFGKTLRYRYDPKGNLIGLTYSDGKELHYAYDAVDRLVEVRDWAGRSTRYAYDDAGNVTEATLPDGSTQVFSYDLANRLIGVADHLPDGSLLHESKLTLDPAGRVIAENIVRPLAASPAPGDTRFEFDVTNRMVAAGTQRASFDADGNMVEGPVAGVPASLEYDSTGRLLRVGATSYRYDADGLRIESRHEASTIRFVQDTSGAIPRVLEEHDADGRIVARYVYGAGLVARIDETAGSAAIYHYDSRGSTLALTDAAGRVTDSYAYDIHGRLIARNGSTPNRFTYHGEAGVEQEPSGLYFMRTRYYDPVSLRFIQPDRVSAGTLEDPQSLNRYTYVRGNPVSVGDPNGDFGWWGAVINVAILAVSDAVQGEFSGVGAYASAAILGAVTPTGSFLLLKETALGGVEYAAGVGLNYLGSRYIGGSSALWGGERGTSFSWQEFAGASLGGAAAGGLAKALKPLSGGSRRFLSGLDLQRSVSRGRKTLSALSPGDRAKYWFTQSYRNDSQLWMSMAEQIGRELVGQRRLADNLATFLPTAGEYLGNCFDRGSCQFAPDGTRDAMQALQQ